MKGMEKIMMLVFVFAAISARCPKGYASSDVTVAVDGGSNHVYVYNGLGSELWNYGTDAFVVSVAVSLDGRYIAVGTLDDKLYLFDRSGTKLWEKDIPINWVILGNGKESKSVAISARGEYVVAACTDGLYVYNNNGTLHWSYGGAQSCVSISPNGKYIATCNWSTGISRLFSIDSVFPLWSKDNLAIWVCTSDSGYTTVSDRSGVFLYDSSGAYPIWCTPLQWGYDFVRVDMSADGMSFVAVNDDTRDDKGCLVGYWSHLYDGTPGWEIFDGFPVWTYVPSTSNDMDYYTVAISASGEIIAAGGAGDAAAAGVQVLDSSGALLQDFPANRPQSVELTADGEFGALGDYGGVSEPFFCFSKDSGTPLWTKALAGDQTAVSIGELGSIRTLTTSATGNGTIFLPPGTYVNRVNAVVEVSAIPDEDYVLSHWELDGGNEGSTNPYSVTMDSNHALEAVFIPEPLRDLTIVAAEGGTTEPVPGTHAYEPDSVAEVNAIPSACYYFDHWELDGNNAGSTNPYSVTMDSNHTLEAVFAYDGYCYSLTIVASGGTTKPASGTHWYEAYSNAEVNAFSNTCYDFDHWELDDINVGSTNPYSVFMDSNHALEAVFMHDGSSRSLAIKTTEGGTTEPSPGTNFYLCGSIVEVNAIADPCYVFDYWKLDGSNAGSANPYLVTMDSNHSLDAFFGCRGPGVEDFNSYADDLSLWGMWVDGWSNETSASVSLDNTIVKSGNSMRYEYANNNYPYYAETWADVVNLPSSIGSDWTGSGIEALVLSFYGQTGNAVEQMYMELTDGDGNTGMVIYAGDMNDIKDPNWHDWNIALADFNASVVDLTDISKIAIGIGDGAVPGGDGVVYIEDIQLCVPRCILLWRSADFTEFDYAPHGYPYSGDCVIDYRELEIMSEEWLMEPPSDPNVDLYTDGVIDFMDFAILADVWLEDGMFP